MLLVRLSIKHVPGKIVEQLPFEFDLEELLTPDQIKRATDIPLRPTVLGAYISKFLYRKNKNPTEADYIKRFRELYNFSSRYHELALLHKNRGSLHLYAEIEEDKLVAWAAKNNVRYTLDLTKNYVTRSGKRVTHLTRDTETQASMNISGLIVTKKSPLKTIGMLWDEKGYAVFTEDSPLDLILEEK